MRAEWRRRVGAAVAWAALATSAQADPGSLRLTGAGAIGRHLAPDLLAGFAATEAGQAPAVTIADTASGFAAMAAGHAEIGMATRPVNEEERILLLRAGLGDLLAPGNARVAALEAIAVVVNRDNAIGLLTRDQIRRLFTGQIKNWSALGGRDLPVTIYVREAGTDAYDAFAALTLGRAAVAGGALVSDSGQSLAEAVAADPGGIGFVGFGDVGGAKAVTIALSCGIAVEPTPFAVRAEEYPLARRLYFYSSANSPPVVQEFLQFAASAPAQQIVRRAGLIDLAPELDAAGAGLPRPGIWEPTEAKRKRDLLTQINRALTPARRLSTTFRFAADGTTLDPRGLADIGRLAAWKRANPGRKLILVGYWSGPGSFDTNLVLSAKRAQAVGSALAGAGAAPELMLAGSTLRPVSCDDEGSRRVEVWAR